VNFNFSYLYLDVGSCTTQSELRRADAVSFVNYINRVVVWLDVL
jgi:hypothetical protein